MRTICITLLLLTSSYAHPLEARIKIAIVDTGLEVTPEMKPYICEGMSFSLDSSNTFVDSNGHGSNVAGLIVEGLDPKKYCIQIIKYRDNIDTYMVAFAIRNAVAMGVSYINLSLSGSGSSVVEYLDIMKALQQGVHIAIAAGNQRLTLTKNFCPVFPTCYKIDNENFRIVGSNTGHYGNQGPMIKYWEDGSDKGLPSMTGTSQATAIHMNKWIKSNKGESNGKK